MGIDEERARRRLTRTPPGWAIVAVLATAGLSSAFMYTMVIPLQSMLPELLGAPREATAWVVTVTLLAAAVATPIAGRLGDMFGKRRIVIALMIVMILGSVIAAVSTDLPTMLIGRALQGAVTGVVPLGIAIMRDVLHPDRLGTAIALMSATMGVGGALGLPVSALITERADWHLLFWCSAALGLVVTGLVFWIVPVSVMRTPGRFDYVGAVGLAVGLVGLLLAISRGNEWGWLSPATIVSGAGGVFVLLGWGWHQLRAAEPLLDLRTAARPAVLLTNLASIGMGFALFASNVIFPQILELPAASGSGFGLTLLQAALVVMPSGLLMMLLSPVSGTLARLIGPRLLFSSGAAAVVLAYAYILVFTDSVWHVFISNCFIGIGIGLGFAAMPLLIMRAVPASATGASNGLNALFRSVGTSTAGAVMGAVLASMVIDFEGQAVPTAEAFELCFWIAGIVAVATLAMTFLIPRGRPAEEPRPSLPT